MALLRALQNIICDRFMGAYKLHTGPVYYRRGFTKGTRRKPGSFLGLLREPAVCRDTGHKGKKDTVEQGRRTLRSKAEIKD